MEWIRCDSCVAQALWEVHGFTGYLTFCGHHKDKYSQALDSWAIEMVELSQIDVVPILEKAVV